MSLEMFNIFFVDDNFKKFADDTNDAGGLLFAWPNLYTVFTLDTVHGQLLNRLETVLRQSS